MEKKEFGMSKEWKGDSHGVTHSVTTNNFDGGVEKDLESASKLTNIPPVKKRKEAKDLGPSEIAEMVFDMMINHRIMESRIEKLENRLNTILSNGFIEKKAV